MILMNKNGNRKLLLIIRVILFVLGFALGFLAMWQVLNENPGIAKRFAIKIVFYAAGGLVPAAVAALSAKPVYFVFAALGKKIRSRAAVIKPNDVAAVMLGTLIGALAGFGTEMLFRIFLKIIALRIFIDIIAAVTAAYIAVILCSQWLKVIEAAPETEDMPHAEKTETHPDANGFILNASAFSEPRIAALCDKWLIGKIYVLKGTKELLDNAASESYDTLYGKGRLELLSVSENDGRVKAEENAAERLGLKIIVLSDQEALNYAGSAPLLILNEI